MKRHAIYLTVFGLMQTAFAADYGSYVGELGKLGTGTATNMMQPAQYTPRYTDNVPMAEQYYGGGVSLPTQFGDAKFNDCKNLPANPDLYLRQECEGVNLIAGSRTKRPDVTISSNEKLVTGTQKIAGDPAETLEKYKWKYPVNEDGSVGTFPSSACPTETITVPAVKTIKRCNEYHGAEMFLCEAALKVNVDPSWNYSCLESKYRNQQYQCGKKLKVVCEKSGPNCTRSGIEAGSLQGDMTVNMTPSGSAHRLMFGTIGDNYWRDGQYDREMTLNIKNPEKLTLFTLSRVEYDDWLIVKVNDKIVYSSYNNQMFAVDYTAEDDMGRRYAPVRNEEGTRLGYAERGESWRRNLNIDIRPYLHQGKNIIWTRTVVGGGGENAIFFNVQQYCDPVCHDRWENSCLELEQRVKQ